METSGYMTSKIWSISLQRFKHSIQNDCNSVKINLHNKLKKTHKTVIVSFLNKSIQTKLKKDLF